MMLPAAFAQRSGGEKRAGRRLRGACNAITGRSAELLVAQRYRALGCGILQERWRGPGGEIDLIARDALGIIVFIEVKRAPTHAQAAERIGPRQLARIEASAAAYLDAMDSGALTEARFDVALVDRSGVVEVVENVHFP